jgi:5-methylcytosine-specific restriction endonuclease McrA
MSPKYITHVENINGAIICNYDDDSKHIIPLSRTGNNTNRIVLDNLDVLLNKPEIIKHEYMICPVWSSNYNKYKIGLLFKDGSCTFIYTREAK